MRYLSLVILVTLVLGAGCTPEGRQDYEDAGKKVVQAVDKDATATDKFLKREGQNIHNGLKGAGHDMHEHVDAATMTGKVKNALNTTKDINSSKIDVDTTPDNVVHLRGSVPNGHEKAEAAKIADGIAGRSYKVSDELKVG